MRSLVPVAPAVALLISAWPLALSAQPAPVPTPQPVPAVSSTPATVPATPTAAPLPPPTPSPAPTPTPAPAASTSPYKFVVVPPSPAPGQPAILEIDMLDSTIHAGTPYSVRVRTTPDVTTLNVSAMGTTMGMQAAAPGLFASDGQVPDGIPFFLLNRSYTITLTAVTANGKSTTYPLSLRLER